MMQSGIKPKISIPISCTMYEDKSGDSHLNFHHSYVNTNNMRNEDKYQPIFTRTAF